MIFDWKEYLYLAQELAGQPQTPSSQEARLRCAISRAYYAAFCTARNYLNNFENADIPRDASAHAIVPRMFGRGNRGGKLIRREIEQRLTAMRKERRKADYDDAVLNLAGISAKNLIDADEVIRLISRIS